MTLVGNGNVGIGTTDPSSQLHIQKDYTIGSANTDHFRPQQTISSATGSGRIVGIGLNPRADTTIHRSITAGSLYYNASIGGNYGFEGYLGLAVATHSSGGSDSYGITEGELVSQTRLAITNHGNVGIGTTTPSQKLDVDGSIGINGKIKFPNRPFVVAGRSAGRVYAPNDFVFNVAAHNTGFLVNGHKFTAPSGFPGYYSFTFTGLGGSTDAQPNTRWYLNGYLIPYGAAHVNHTFASSSLGNRHALSCHVCCFLNEGDYVTLRVHHESVYGGQTAHTTIVAMYLFTP
jgi:hypothetical protein